jgi:hypothetical protein
MIRISIVRSSSPIRAQSVEMLTSLSGWQEVWTAGNVTSVNAHCNKRLATLIHGGLTPCYH